MLLRSLAILSLLLIATPTPAQSLYASWGSFLVELNPDTGEVMRTLPLQPDPPPLFGPPALAPNIVALSWHPTLGLLGLERDGRVEAIDLHNGARSLVFVCNDTRPGVRYQALAVDPLSGLLWIGRDVYDRIYDPPQGWYTDFYQESYLAIGDIDSGLFADQLQRRFIALAFDGNGTLWGNVTVPIDGKRVNASSLGFAPSGLLYFIGLDDTPAQIAYYGTMDPRDGTVNVILNGTALYQTRGLVFVP